MDKELDTTTDCVSVSMASDGSGGYVGSWSPTTPSSGTFATSVTFDLMNTSIPNGTFTSGFSSPGYTFGTPQPASECSPELHPTYWRAYSVTISPSNWSVPITITVTMTAS